MGWGTATVDEDALYAALGALKIYSPLISRIVICKSR
jgi:hypothetical protein